MNTSHEVLPLTYAAKRLRVPANWLRDEAEAGRLPCLRAGRAILFNPEIVARILAERASVIPSTTEEATVSA